MSKSTLRYDRMVENALRGVVKDALTLVSQRGLPGAHHFYITFRTGYPGVDIPDFLTAQYPQDMTIVLEHQFWGLEVDDVKFGVTLSFKNQPQRLTIPLAAITEFADPSVKFGLEFPNTPASVPKGGESGTIASLGAPTSIGSAPISIASAIEADAKTDSSKPAAAEGEKAGEVVKLDLFRRK